MISSQLSSLEGRLRHCIRYKRGKKGKKVCAKYRAGPGSPKGRRKAGIRRKFVERSTTKKRASRRCMKWGKSGGRKVCRKWRHVSKTRVVGGKRRPVRRAGKRGACLRRKRSAKTGRMYCAKYAGAKRGTRKRTTKARKARKGNGRRASRICIRYGRGKGGKSVCKKFKTVSRSEARKYRATRAKYGRKKIPKSLRLTA